MTSVGSLFFQGGFSRSYSALTQYDLGFANCCMELFIGSSGRYGQIEWLIGYQRGGEEAVYIDLYFDGNTLTGYDGVFPLPTDAIRLLRNSGYVVNTQIV